MSTFLKIRLQGDRPTTRRPQVGRLPLVEDLEGRQLLSTFGGSVVGQHIGVSTDAIVGSHIGTNVSAEVVGAHIG